MPSLPWRIVQFNPTGVQETDQMKIFFRGPFFGSGFGLRNGTLDLGKVTVVFPIEVAHHEVDIDAV
jgi:hypothetical protein